MADNTLISYDLNGKKLSFANWISNLSPTDTPFVSMTGKEAISQTLFQWQTDVLEAANADNAVPEGSTATDQKRKPTKTLTNVTQILRKVVKVSDTANALANYGRGKELQYQMEKAGKEIKRDLEAIFLSDQEKDDGTGVGLGGAGKARKTACFKALVAAKDAVDDDTGAVVHKQDELSEDSLFDITYNLYLSGSTANIIMFHPLHAKFFAALQENDGAGHRVKMFNGPDTKFRHYVSEIIDPLGCAYKLIPNRFMPQDSVYFLDASDWTQMVLRAPERIKLAKDGSYEKWMMEMEVGLRHRNPFASGVLDVTPPKPPVESVTIAPKTLALKVGASGKVTGTVTPAGSGTVAYSTSDDKVATVNASGNVTAVKVGTATITASAGGKSDTCVVTVTAADVPVTGVTIAPAKLDFDLITGGTKTGNVIGTVAPANATDKTVTYASSDTTVATVSAAGLVTGLKVGTANITAKAGGKTSTNCVVTVVDTTVKAK